VRLNTDAIDNSAGVNSSDVEVNIKVALSTPVADGRLTLATRNPLLASMTDDVARLVLRNNYLQSLAVSLAERKGAADIADEKRLMRSLEAEGRLDRTVEFLPADLALNALEREGKGLTRPELAVMLAYAKLAFHDHVLASDVPDDPYFAVELRRYFPDGVREGFPDAVETHRLRREIIATGLANAVVNRIGPGGAQRMAEDSGRPLAEVARAYALTRDAFGILDVNTAIDALDARVPGTTQLALYAAVQRFTTDRMTWFMRHADFSTGLATLIERFRVEPAQPAAGAAEAWIAGGAPPDIAAAMARLAASAAVPDAVLVAEQAGSDPAGALATMRTLAELLEVDRVRHAAGAAVAADGFERQALLRASDEVDHALRALAAQVLAGGGSGSDGVQAWAERRQGAIARARRVIAEALTGQPSLGKAAVAAGALRDLTGE